MRNLPTSHSKLVVEPDHESSDSVLFTMQYANNKMLYQQQKKHPFFNVHMIRKCDYLGCVNRLDRRIDRWQGPFSESEIIYMVDTETSILLLSLNPDRHPSRTLKSLRETWPVPMKRPQQDLDIRGILAAQGDPAVEMSTVEISACTPPHTASVSRQSFSPVLLQMSEQPRVTRNLRKIST